MCICFEPIGVVRSCFSEKFGTPRQPGLTPSADGVLTLHPAYGTEAALRGLASFSHIWVMFLFHEHADRPWRETVRPPRLGGNRRVGVFASRSGFRPNPLGLSVVRLEKIALSPARLYLSGVDMIDGTPVIDIKPYVPYADSIPDAVAGFAAQRPATPLSVTFSDAAEAACRRLAPTRPRLRQLIVEVLQADPRPAYYGNASGREHFGTRLYDLDIKWRCRQETVLVTAIDNGP